MDGKRAALALTLVLVVSCGGGTGGTAATSATSGTSAAPTAAATQAAGAPAATQPAGGASVVRFNDVLAAARLSQYKITYKYTVGGAGSSLSGEQSWFFKPPKQRFDFSSGLGGQTTLMSVFALPDGTYYCFSAGTTKQCIAIKGAGSPLDSNLAAVFQRQMMENPGAYGATAVETRTIAGQTGTCYDVTPAAGAAAGFTAGRWCFSREGIMLLSSFTAQGSTVALEATNVSLTVPDSDFELPAKPISSP